MSRRCTARTQDGSPCRAWAVRGTEPPRCSAHAGRNVGAGAPAGNQNAKTHGAYSDLIEPHELARLVADADEITLQDEIALTRLALRRLTEGAAGGGREERMGERNVQNMVVVAGVTRQPQDEVADGRQEQPLPHQKERHEQNGPGVVALRGEKGEGRRRREPAAGRGGRRRAGRASPGRTGP